MANDIAQMITDRIIEELEKGTAPWVKSWKNVPGGPVGRVPYNPVSKTIYRGANHFWLSMTGARYSRPWFITFKQAKALGGNVKKGEKGHPVVFWSIKSKEETGPDGDITSKSWAFMRSYTVFNLDQCENLRAIPEPAAAPTASFEPEALPLAMVEALGLKNGLNHGGDSAHYSPTLDYIQMPNMAGFKDGANYHATLLHEAVHATGHKSRLDRLTPARFGDESYAYEELVAELGAAMLCAYCGIDGDLRHAGYIQSWLKALKNDKTFIISAAAKAQKAMDFLVAGVSGEEVNEEEEALAA